MDESCRNFESMAGWTGLGPATFAVTVQSSNQLSYHPNTYDKVYQRYPKISILRRIISLFKK